MPVRVIVDGRPEALASEDRDIPFLTLPTPAWRPSDLPRGYRDPDLTQASSPRDPERAHITGSGSNAIHGSQLHVPLEIHAEPHSI
jgi:hypothetical protein